MSASSGLGLAPCRVRWPPAGGVRAAPLGLPAARPGAGVLAAAAAGWRSNKGLEKEGAAGGRSARPLGVSGSDGPAMAGLPWPATLLGRGMLTGLPGRAVPVVLLKPAAPRSSCRLAAKGALDCGAGSGGGGSGGGGGGAALAAAPPCPLLVPTSMSGGARCELLAVRQLQCAAEWCWQLGWSDLAPATAAQQKGPAERVQGSSSLANLCFPCGKGGMQPEQLSTGGCWSYLRTLYSSSREWRELGFCAPQLSLGPELAL